MQEDPFSLEQDDKPEALVRARLLEAFRGNLDAVRLIDDIRAIAHTWDDLIDQDRKPSPDEINQAFAAATVGLNLNAFFRQHASLITPVLLSGILNWYAANDLEKDGREHCLDVAYVIRCAVGDVALICAFIVGGMAHAQAHAARLRMLTQQDSRTDYLNDFRRAHEAS